MLLLKKISDDRKKMNNIFYLGLDKWVIITHLHYLANH